MKNLFLTFFVFFFAGCSGVSMIKRYSSDHHYSEDFRKEINEIKRLYSEGKSKKAKQRLMQLDDVKLSDNEKASKYNTLGVVDFSEMNLEKSIWYFKKALSLDSEDRALVSQLYLNLSSAYFKLSLYNEAIEEISRVDEEVLSQSEKKKYHRLAFVLYYQKQNTQKILYHIVNYMRDLNDISSLKESPFLDRLTNTFLKQSRSEKMRFLQNFEKDKIFVIGYLGYLEAEKLYQKGKKEEAKNLIEWVEDNFDNFNEIKDLVVNFNFRMDSISKINPMAIGVVLPLSGGGKSKYAKRALIGIDSAIKSFGFKKEPTLYIKDSMGNSVVGARSVKELIEKNFVSVIIGGLYSKEAISEYKEARKNGVLFISLSQIFLPREEKNHLLVEIPGSVESLISSLLSEKSLNYFGKRVAIVYPDNPRGRSYVNEFWNQAYSKSVNVVGVHSYPDGATDFRDSVRSILSLKYPRERQEELEILSKIHALQKRGTIRRVQTLSPVIDFDWVFTPSHPKDAIQLLPSFEYFDAFKLKYVGDPRWRARLLTKNNRKLGTIYFIGNDLDKNQEEFRSKFFSLYKKRPYLIEMLAHDGMKLALDLISQKEISTRNELESVIVNQTKLEGVTGVWIEQEGLWVKKMSPLKMSKGKIENIVNDQANYNLNPESA